MKRFHLLLNSERMEYFQGDERRIVIELYKSIRVRYAEPFSGKRYYDLKHTIVDAVKDKGFQRDIFGFNPLIKSLQTVLVVIEEIGQNVEVVQSCLLSPYFSDDGSLGKLENLFGRNVRTILHGLIRTELAESMSFTRCMGQRRPGIWFFHGRIIQPAVLSIR